MKILAIETSCEHASVALLSDREVRERHLEGHTNHSEYLLPTLRSLLAEADVPLSALAAIAFGAGPGAFTGLRLACGAAQGLAMGAGLGVVPVSSLAALALQAEGESVFVATDARMGEIYSAAFRREGRRLIEVGETTCAPPERLELPPSGTWFGLGSGFKAYAERITDSVRSRLSGCDPDAVPGAREIAELAALRVAAGEIVAPEFAGPLYVRDKVALTTAERLARGGRA